MSNPVIEVKVNYNIAGGDTPALMNEAIDTRGVPIYCLQIICTGVVGAPLDGLLQLIVSNDNINFRAVQPSFVLNAVVIDTAGNSSYFIFVGMAEGVGTARFVNISFTANGLTAGIITQVIYSGELGTA